MRKGLESAPAAAPAQAAQPTAAAKQSGDGTTLPALTKLEGGKYGMASLKDKVVVLNFWATWCAPCIKELPSFNKLQQDFAAKGVVVVGVSMDDDGATSVIPFLKKHPIEYPLALFDDSKDKQYKLESLPVTMVFSRAGKLLKRFDGFTDEAALREVVQKSL